eukprot:3118045-Pyramimonas_sp.AAC.1
MDPYVQQQAPGLVVPSSMGELRPEILATHAAQQANVAMQSARQRRDQERRVNGMLSRAGQPAISLPRLCLRPLSLALLILLFA